MVGFLHKFQNIHNFLTSLLFDTLLVVTLLLLTLMSYVFVKHHKSRGIKTTTVWDHLQFLLPNRSAPNTDEVGIPAVKLAVTVTGIAILVFMNLYQGRLKYIIVRRTFIVTTPQPIFIKAKGQTEHARAKPNGPHPGRPYWKHKSHDSIAQRIIVNSKTGQTKTDNS